MNETYLLTGSNIGNRLVWLQKAAGMIGERCGIVSRQSSVYETAAWGINTQPAFLNQVLQLQTIEKPEDLLRKILDIEIELGRKREIKWGERTIDIDILFYNHDIINIPGLIIPHPYLHERRFTLVPLLEIAPDFIHPLLNKSIKTLLAECKDPLEVKKWEN